MTRKIAIIKTRDGFNEYDYEYDSHSKITILTSITDWEEVSEEDFRMLHNASYSIREALIAVGLVGKGGNYVRCKKLLQSGVALKTKEIDVNKKNSQYGKIWICHLDNKENKKIDPIMLTEYIKEGWITGRVTKFGQVAQLVETR